MLTRTARLTFAFVCAMLVCHSAVAQQGENPPRQPYQPSNSWSGQADAGPGPMTIENPLVRRPDPRTQTQSLPSYPQTDYAAPTPSTPAYPAAPSGAQMSISDEAPSESPPVRFASAEEPAAAAPYSPPSEFRLPVVDVTPQPIAAAKPRTADAPEPAQKIAPPSAESSNRPLPLAPRANDGDAADLKPNAANTTGALGGVVGSLAIVLALFFAIVWFSKRYMPQAASALPKDALETLGWAPLAGRQQMQLVRIGNKLVLIAVGNGAAETLTEVTDLLEVERITAMCRRSKPGSSSATFRQVMSEFEREPAPGGFVGSPPADAAGSPRTGRTLGRLGAAIVLAASLVIGGSAMAQSSTSLGDRGTTSIEADAAPMPTLPEAGVPPLPTTGDALDEILSGGPKEWMSPRRLSSSLQIMLLLTVLSLAPAVLLMTTSFVRIIVVLGLLKQALGTQQLPPSQVLTALALFMTLLVMTPTWREVYDDGIRPYSEGKLASPEEAWNRCAAPIKRFLSRQIEVAGNSDDVWLFYDYLPEARERTEPPTTYDEIPLTALLPAFMLSELKTAFLIGFQIYLPFMILDIVVSSVTISMGMMMLPPVMISLPLKLLLFVLVDGWNLVVGMLMESFGPAL